MTTVQRLRQAPASIPRQYMLTHILSSLSLDADAYDELFEAVGADTSSVSHIASHVVRAGCSAEHKYTLLLGGLSRFTSRYASTSPEIACIGALAGGIAEVFDSHVEPATPGEDSEPLCYTMERHPMVRAMYLVQWSAFVLVDRIEARFVRGAPEGYFSAVQPFLVAAIAADEEVRRCVRNVIARIGANGLVSVDVVAPFLLEQVVVPCDASTPDGMHELSESIQDVVDVICANEASDSTVALLVETLFGRFQRAEAVAMTLRCLSYFLDELSEDMILPIAIRGMQLGEDPNARSCFELVAALLSSLWIDIRPGSAARAIEDVGPSPRALTLATLECVCLRASFYCQPGSRVREPVRKCLAMCRSVGQRCLWGPSEHVLYRLKLLALRAYSSNGVSSINVEDIAYVLAHLSHQSIYVRLEALCVVRSLLSDSLIAEDASFFALPAVLQAIRLAGRSFASCGDITMAFYMRELLFTLTCLGEARACVPFVARTLQSLLIEGAPEELVSVAIRLIGRLYLSSHKAYATLKVVLLGCDMRREAMEALTMEQLAAMHTLVEVCDQTPEKGKDFVHMIHECVSSPHATLAAAGLGCVRRLCAAGILDFEKAWVVVSKMYPDLPEDDELAAAWVDLIGCALLEDDLNEAVEAPQEGSDFEARAKMLANVMDLVWEATTHTSPLVRSKAYGSLEAIDWDTAEALNCLRPPVAYARLLVDETDPSALEALESLMDVVLQMEYEDRRKQLIELKSHVPAQVQQSHRQRFYKLTQSIPRVLLKELSLLGSGAFVALNLGSRDHVRVAKDLCATDAAASIDLMVEPEYVPLLVRAWTTFVERWPVADESGKSPDLDPIRVWNALGLAEQAADARILNPNIPAAMVACASLRQDLFEPTVHCLVRTVEDSLQHQNVRNVCVVLAAMCVNLAGKHISSNAHEALVRCIERADVAEDHRMLAIDIMHPDANVTDGANDTSKSAKYSVRETCDIIRRSTLAAYANGRLDDYGVCDALAKLSAMLSSPTDQPRAGYVLLTMSRLLTGCMSNGFRDNRNEGTGATESTNDNPWTLESMVSRLGAFLKHHVAALPNVRANAGHACHGLSVCLQYQMKDMKNQDESCSEENAVENELEAICSMPTSSPIRMGCVPFIADMCARASMYKDVHLDQDESLGSLSNSAVGYLSQALLRGRFVDESRVKLLLSCLARAPRLAQKDWSACLRRCLKAHPIEDVHVAVVNFAALHPNAASDFITESAFAGSTPLLPVARRVALSSFDRLSVVMHGEVFARCLLDAAADTSAVSDANALARGLRAYALSPSEGGAPQKSRENVSLARDVLGQLADAHCPVCWKELLLCESLGRITFNLDRIGEKMELCAACVV